MGTVIKLIIGVVCLIIGVAIGIFYRKNVAEKTIGSAEQEATRIINDAKAEIESQKQAAISEIRQQVAALSVEISEKVLRQKLGTDKAQMDYINQMLDEVTANNK